MGVPARAPARGPRGSRGDDRVIKGLDAWGASHDVRDLSGLNSKTGWSIADWPITHWAGLGEGHKATKGTGVRIGEGGGDIIALSGATQNRVDAVDFLFWCRAHPALA